MSNIVNISTSTDAALDAIVAEIAERVSRTVENVWHIGDALNRAKEHFSCDQEFGQWRRQNITEPLGIAERTQRNFQRIARNWKREDLPRFLGLTALTDVAALPEIQQEQALAYFETQAVAGKKIAGNIATLVVKQAREGKSAEEITQRYNPEKVNMPGITDVEPIEAPAPLREPAPQEPVVVDQDGNVEPHRPAIPRPVKQGDTPEAWAKSVVARLRRENGHRHEFLAALKAELTVAGMFEVTSASASAVISERGRKSRISITD